MNFFVNKINTYTAKCNIVNLSFEGIKDLPKEVYSFDLYIPASVELAENKVNNLPYWLAKNIFEGNQSIYILKILHKQGKKSVHTRAEKAMIGPKILDAFEEAKKLNVEEPIIETGDFVGEAGDQLFDEFKVIKMLNSGNTCLRGIWRHTGHGWAHPSYGWCLWELEDHDGHTFILKCNNDEMNDELGQKEGFFKMKTNIVGHNIFRGRRQTEIKIRKQKI
jgi:hypothetical protein